MLSWANRSWRSMGSTAEMIVYGEGSEAAADWAVHASEQMEQAWSRFRPDSELSRLNASPGRAVEVSPLLWAALERAARGWQETDGFFDPTILPSLRRIGYDRNFADVERDGDSPVLPLPAVGFGSVVLDATHRTVTLPPGVEIDLGGIGKGLAADLTVIGLRRQGIMSASVSFGGDLRVTGPGPDDEGVWDTMVENPFDDTELLRFPLVEEAIVQSTRLFRTWNRGGEQQHHLVDPRTGRAAQTGVAAVVITGPEAWRSEVLAKAALIAGPDRGLALIERVGLDGWMVLDDRTMRATRYVRAEVTHAVR
jgi:thiamine biosynthesis lipoprotein